MSDDIDDEIEMESVKRSDSAYIYTDMLMDSRCPRQLKDHSEIGMCQRALDRLNAKREFIQENKRIPSEEEESQMAGCPYSINNHKSLYCTFVEFSKIKTAKNEKTETTQIAALLMIDKEDVHDIVNDGVKKLKAVTNKELLPDEDNRVESHLYVNSSFSDIEQEFDDDYDR